MGDSLYLSGSDILRWRVEQVAGEFAMQVSEARKLQRDVRTAIEALPRRGLEISGILIGTRTSSGVLVTGFQPIESSYPEGPAFRAPEPAVAAALDTARESGEIVGIYRSRTDGGAETDDQDALLLKHLEARTAVLLVRGAKETQPDAQLGWWTGSRVEWCTVSVPFNTWISTGEVAPSAPDEPLTHTFVAEMMQADRSHSRRRLIQQLAIAAASGIAVVVAVSLLHFRTSAPPESTRSREYASFGKPLLEEPRTVAVREVRKPETLKQALAETPQQPRTQPPTATVDTAERVSDRAVPILKAQLPSPRKPVAVRPPVLMAELPNISPATAQPFGNVALPPIAAAPPPPRPQPVQYVPPVLARQGARVVLPPDLRRMLQNEVVISLRVAVDSAGHVTAVVPVRQLGRTEQSLARSYELAIRSWEFDPAKRNGVPAPGEVVLNFRVSP
jgi:hypothetical protein